MAKTDPTIAGCLEKVRRGDVSAVGVLADYLEENGLPHAKMVRGLWNRFSRWGEVVRNRPDQVQARRKHTKWERLAFHRRWLRERIAGVFKRSWKTLRLESYK